MTIIEVLEQVRELLRSKGRITYRVLQVQFDLNGASLEALKEELIEAERVAVDENGKVLVWAGGTRGAGSQSPVDSQRSSLSSAQSPLSYTPPHLAERIRAEQAALEARGATDGERKTITALFADIKGSMALMEDLDPEEARALIDPALQLMMDAVHRYEGYMSSSPRVTASSPSLVHQLPTKIIPTAPSMLPCACRRRSASTPTPYDWRAADWWKFAWE